MTRLYWINLQ
ncbi:inner membrane transport permease yadH domain protein, partial [Yersinia pestis PY-01]